MKSIIKILFLITLILLLAGCNEVQTKRGIHSYIKQPIEPPIEPEDNDTDTINNSENILENETLNETSIVENTSQSETSNETTNNECDEKDGIVSLNNNCKSIIVSNGKTYTVELFDVTESGDACLIKVNGELIFIDEDSEKEIDGLTIKVINAIPVRDMTKEDDWCEVMIY